MDFYEVCRESKTIEEIADKIESYYMNKAGAAHNSDCSKVYPMGCKSNCSRLREMSWVFTVIKEKARKSGC